ARQSRRGPQLPVPEGKPTPLTLLNKNCMFEPHVVVMRSGLDTLEILNPDPDPHNAMIQSLVKPSENFVIPPGGRKTHQFNKSELTPVQVTCSIHPWMRAYVVAFDHPYVGVTDENGKVEIHGLPVGLEITFRGNHESATKAFAGLGADGNALDWSRNQFKVKIQPGVNDLGTIKLSHKVFGRDK
ncbi:MAG: methylamine utilization protein, partial [Planctomycetota bacterium]